VASVRIESLRDVIGYLRCARTAMSEGETRLALRYLCQARHDFGFTVGLCGGGTMAARCLRGAIDQIQESIFAALPRRAT
jgi:hypothetical protein